MRYAGLAIALLTSATATAQKPEQVAQTTAPGDPTRDEVTTPPATGDDVVIEPVDEAEGERRDVVLVPADEAVARVDLDVNVRVETHDAEGEEPERRRGTHFLFELSGGVTLAMGPGGEVGGASQLLLGAGGRLSGGWLRFYMLAGLSHATLRSSVQSDGLGYDATRHHLDLVLGLRVYAPIYGPVRLFTDFLAGGTHAWSELGGGPLGARRQDGWAGVAQWGFGLQVRVLHELSVGGRLGLRWAGDPLDELREHVGFGDERPSLTLTGGAAWHF